jgi:hemoglobin
MAERKPGEYGYEDASLRAMGGEEAVRMLVDRFYDVMHTVPEAAHIRRMHPADLAVSRDKLTVFLTGWLGGPKRYAERWGRMHIPAAHAHLTIDAPERDAWLLCMETAMADMPVTEDFRAYFMREITVPANRVMMVSQGRRRAQS